MITGPTLTTTTFLTTGTIATYTVASTGTFLITADGAAGGSYWSSMSPGAAPAIRGGNGYALSADFQLTQGTVIEIIAGGVGGNRTLVGGGGGGGGSFVYDQTDGILLEAAGGGGGAASGGGYINAANEAGINATGGSTGMNGGMSQLASSYPLPQGGQGGVSGGGGKGGAYSNPTVHFGGGGGGGGGFSGNGTQGTGYNNGGTAFLNGGFAGGNGGFGGGGAGASSSGAGGGGGGYSGGGGGGQDGGGGGGGSYINLRGSLAATNITDIGAVQTSNGYILIQSAQFAGVQITNPVIVTGSATTVGANTLVTNPVIAGGTLDLAAGSYVQGNLSFTNTGGELLVEQAVGGVTLNPVDAITGFAAGDYINLAGAGLNPALTSLTVAADGTLSIISGATTYDVLIQGITAGQNNFIFYGARGLTESTHSLSTSISAGISLTAAGPFLAPFTVTNTGTVNSTGNAISSSLAGASLANQGLLSASAGIGVDLTGGGTIVNAGTIYGAGGAVYLGGNGNNLLVDTAGSVFSGTVSAAASSSSTLALTGTGGNMAGLGSQFTGFAALTELAGASWQLRGNFTGAAGAYGYAAGGAGKDAFTEAAGAHMSNYATLTGGTGGQSHLQGGQGGAGANLLGGGTMFNAGNITGGASSFAFASTGATALTGGDGIEISNGASVFNVGNITGGRGGFIYGVGGQGGAGAYLNGGTLETGGTISGGAGGGSTPGNAGYAVRFGATASTLIFDWPATFIGKAAANGVNDTLGLDGMTGTLSGLGTQFTGFAAINELSSAYWSITSNFTAAAGAYGYTAGTAGQTAAIMQPGGRGYTNLTNLATITGGTGGQSHLQGGAGGAGISVSSGARLYNHGAIAGGDSSFAFASKGATALAGGSGVVLAAGGFAANYGSITGGLGGFIYASDGTGGAGGAGVYINGGTLINAGTISGGAGRGQTPAATGAQGDAVQFGAAASTLADKAGAVFNGLVQGYGNDTLDLTGTNGTLSGFGTQFTGFSSLSIASGGTWLVSGNSAGLASGVNIYGFTTGDTINLTGVSAATEVFTNNQLQLLDGGGTVVAALNIAESTSISSTNFSISSDGNGGTDITMCFYPGTRLATPHGEVAVEDIVAGTLLRLASGGSLPVRWVGRSEISTRFANPLRALPVRICAGALGHGLPRRDLLVSPDHAMFLEGVLVQAGALVNGITILREANVPERFTYYHVELAKHELLLAEGAATESFVDNVDRMHFSNWNERGTAHTVEPIEEMPYPRAKSHRQVPSSLRQMLAQYAQAVISGAA